MYASGCRGNSQQRFSLPLFQVGSPTPLLSGGTGKGEGMKTTVCTRDRKLVVQPSVFGGLIELKMQGINGRLIGDVLSVGAVLTPDEAGALIFGLEQALEANQIAVQRVAA